MTKVKICGLSNPESVATAVEAGADYIGFVFAPSRRQVSLAEAKKLSEPIPERVKKVGVFVSPSLAEVTEAIQEVPLDLVQIHGDWEDSLTEQLGVPLIRAIQIRAEQSVRETTADYLLFDAPVAGSGQTFDWSLLAEREISRPFFIAGGLTVENVAEAQALFDPYGLDVSSGVEEAGVKDLDKIRAFIERVKR